MRRRAILAVFIPAALAASCGELLDLRPRAGEVDAGAVSADAQSAIPIPDAGGDAGGESDGASGQSDGGDAARCFPTFDEPFNNLPDVTTSTSPWFGSVGPFMGDPTTGVLSMQRTFDTGSKDVYLNLSLPDGCNVDLTLTATYEASVTFTVLKLFRLVNGAQEDLEVSMEMLRGLPFGAGQKQTLVLSFSPSGAVTLRSPPQASPASVRAPDQKGSFRNVRIGIMQSSNTEVGASTARLRVDRVTLN